MTDRLPVRTELYLLAHDEEGKPLVNVPILGVGLAAALMIDLAITGQIEAASGRVVARPRPSGGAHQGMVNGGIAGHSLSELYDARAHPPTPLEVVMTWKEGVYDRIRGEMVAADIIYPVKMRRLGLVPVTRYKMLDEGNVVKARTGLRRSVTGQAQASPADAALCGLLVELQLERALYLAIDNATLRESMRAIAARHYDTVKQIFVALAEGIRFQSTSAS
ncbi:MAG TPA: GPP34 family phosphoprotein [Stackebrandtia sp.]|uniref:GOLPH3/VPS74 family protein n=1 Tax=Stackebrandtia sp. TaxID=2023065 RepID=UPI002D40A772|nr:GPP34 family phosphoprotein [Stackebrandtia sp.]HZE41316.1 GPP34 family phosphoprotein [Stackebrandtia sp.]